MKLIVGCGYLGHRVARRWSQAGEQVTAVTRSAKRAEAFRSEGLQAIVADVTAPETLANLPAAESVFYGIGYDRAAGISQRTVYVEGLRAVLDALPPGTGRIVYISSTGVYGQTDGQWIDEGSPCHPARESGQICLAAENVLREHWLGKCAIILRLAGIYGPGRVPNLRALLAGEPIAAPADGFSNLIHVDDAASVVLAADERAVPPALYNVSDGQPAQRRAWYEEAARLCQAPPPTFVAPSPDSPAAQRATADKRVDNSRMLNELAVRLAYPSYREGLADSFAGE